MNISNKQGMTLIELLVAMAIFAVMTTAMFITFDSFHKSKEGTDRAAERLKRMQLAFNIMTRDAIQMVPRPIRDEFGSDLPLPALKAESTYSVEFSRAGWNRSPFSKSRRSEIQRVMYYMEDKQLIRASWAVLDRAEDSAPNRTVLIDGIESFAFEFAYQDDEDKWQAADYWPPDSVLNGRSSGAGQAAPSSPYFAGIQYIYLPKVMEFRVETQDFGMLTRKFLIANKMEEAFFQ